jgi:hypothetical protein
MGGAIPPLAWAGFGFWSALEIANRGSAPWPVAVLPDAPPDYGVHLVARWWPAEGPHTDASMVARHDLALARDVPPREVLRQRTFVPTPPEPGVYHLEIGVEQTGGARFERAGNVRVAADVNIVPVPARK